MSLQPRQIAKVVYEALRAYSGTIGAPDTKHWEGATQAERDEILNRVDATLRGVPYQTGIAPSDQIKGRLLTSIVGVFVGVYNPPVHYSAPSAKPIEPLPIPVEVFANPDVPVEPSVAVPGSEVTANAAEITRANAEDGETPVAVEPTPLAEALAQADANIAKENA